MIKKSERDSFILFFDFEKLRLPVEIQGQQ